MDIIVVAFTALSVPEQEQVWRRLNEIRLDRLAGEDTETGRCIKSLRRIAEHAGSEDLSPDAYRSSYKALKATDPDVLEINVVIRHFGSWVRAKEALLLSAERSPLEIQRRFRARLKGKAHVYKEPALRESFMRCADELGHPPLVVEYEHWRLKEIELAKAQGEDIWIPSSSPFRRLYRDWEGAARAYGFSEDAIKGRLEPGREKANRNLEPFKYGSQPHESSAS